MTQDERQVLVYSVFAALRRLVPKRNHGEFDKHLAAMTAILDDHAADAFEHGRENGRASVDAAAYQRGKVDGASSVECRADRRDPLDADDPPELRSVH